MATSLESGANLTTEREEQPKKQNPESRSTEEGIQIDESDEQFENAQGEIRESREPGSNVTAERDKHSPKPTSSSTDEGMKNDESDEQSVNAPSSIDRR
jgi:hypothetical protein